MTSVHREELAEQIDIGNDPLWSGNDTSLLTLHISLVGQYLLGEAPWEWQTAGPACFIQYIVSYITAYMTSGDGYTSGPCWDTAATCAERGRSHEPAQTQRNQLVGKQLFATGSRYRACTDGTNSPTITHTHTHTPTPTCQTGSAVWVTLDAAKLRRQLSRDQDREDGRREAAAWREEERGGEADDGQIIERQKADGGTGEGDWGKMKKKKRGRERRGWGGGVTELEVGVKSMYMD